MAADTAGKVAADAAASKAAIDAKAVADAAEKLLQMLTQRHLLMQERPQKPPQRKLQGFLKDLKLHSFPLLLIKQLRKTSVLLKELRNEVSSQQSDMKIFLARR